MSKSTDSSVDDTLALLFFVMALIYLCFLVVLVVRTAVPIFSVKKYPNTRPMQMFRAFYGSLWIQMILNCVLYWVLFGEKAGNRNIATQEDDSGTKSVALIFMPYVLMCLDYALMYVQLDEMQRRARMQGGVAYIKKENHDKLQKIMTIITLIYVGIFILVQIVVMIFTCLDMVDPGSFQIELNSLVFVLMIFLNAFALVSYCRNAGNPYLNAKNKKYVRKFKLVLSAWNLAFLTKFLFSAIGVNIVRIDEQQEQQDSFAYSVETFANIMLTEIIPFYLVLDKKIVKILTLNFLEINDGNEEDGGNPTNMMLSDRNNSGSSSTSQTLDCANDEERDGQGAPGAEMRLSTSPGRDSQLRARSGQSSTGEINNMQMISNEMLAFMRLTQTGSSVYSDNAIAQERKRLEAQLTLKDDAFQRGAPFTRPWYITERKFLKQKLGSLYQCHLKSAKQDEGGSLCRAINYDRISYYQVEAFFQDLARLSLYKLQNYVVMPQGVHVSSKMEITVIVPELISLHDLIYQPQRINGSDEGISLKKKIMLLIELAKVMSQLHSLAYPYAHGNLNSHNVFVELGAEEDAPSVRIGELEMSDFKRYANMFFSYRSLSVYSAPECLSQPKKRVDPTVEMDIYSFGFLMWELLYEQEPFEGDLKSTIEYVVKEDARPRILTVGQNNHETTTVRETVDLEVHEENLLLTEDLANIIRRCWQTDVSQRPSLAQVALELTQQIRVLFESEDVGDGTQLIHTRD